MPPIVIAAGIAAVGTIGGAVLSSSGQKSAANTAAAAQQQATDSQLQLGQQNIAFQQGIYDKNTALLNPFVQRGNEAGGAINSLLGLGGSQPVAASQAATQTASPYTQQPLNYALANPSNPSGPNATSPFGDYGVGGFGPNGTGFPRGRSAMADYYDNQLAQQSGQSPAQQAQIPSVTQPAAPAGQTPQQASTDAFNNFANSAGMQFQLQQGENAINNGYAAKGQLQSGAALKALQGYGQNTALNNYFLPYLGLLQGQQATGAQSGAAIAGVGSNFGNTVSNIYGQQSNAIQNGADATSNAALLRGQANANFGNSLGSALGTFGSSFFPSGTSYAPPAASGGYNVGGGTANYFAKNPFGGNF